MTATLISLLALSVVLLIRPGFGFRSQKPEDYADTGPVIDIREQLAGNLVSEGVIYGPFGRVSSRFIADMSGDWKDGTGTLSEAFRYASGSTQDRKWYLEMGQNGAFTATADDIIGVAKGQQSGAAVRMTYRIRLAESAGGHVLDVIDWMYLMENGSIMNRSEMRKLGVKVGELVATIRPTAD